MLLIFSRCLPVFPRNAQLTHASGTSFQPASVPVWCLCSSFPNGTDGRRNNPTRHPAPHRWSTTVAVPLASVLDGVFAAVFVERKVTTRDLSPSNCGCSGCVPLEHLTLERFNIISTQRKQNRLPPPTSYVCVSVRVCVGVLRPIRKAFFASCFALSLIRCSEMS